jgi:peptidoglycan hydrolase-like amidase/uncharacterized cupredoxin-like copper-binding protein
MTKKILQRVFLSSVLLTLMLAISPKAMAADSLNIISRREWGADEELRIWNPDRSGSGSGSSSYNPCASIEDQYGDEFKLTKIIDYTSDGQPLTWPLQYANKIEKFVVHHTDSEIRDMNGDDQMDTRDYSAIVRAIYRYHALSRGWGDIGYNYLIDPLGNIYEGRYGGDKVIGAHAVCYNHGTIGISVIGSYENESIPEPAQKALIKLIAAKAKQHGIDPKGVTTFRGKRLSNVIGHRDVGVTTCPGDAFYADLPEIKNKASLAMRDLSESELKAESYDYNAELSGEIGKVSVGPGERKTITLKYRNTGKKAWDDSTWMHVALNNDANARVVPVVEGKSFVAADLKESSVAPGKTGTFEVQVEGGYKSGHYAFEVSPVVNGRYKISRASEYITLEVEKASHDYEVVGHDFPKGTVFQGEHILGTLTLKNTGNTVWRNYGDNAIALGTSDPKDRASIFIKENPFRVGYMLDSEVAPGETADFVLDLHIPEDKEGTVIERFTPVIENVGWLADKALGFKVNIKEPQHLAKTTKLERLGYMYPGERRYVTVEMKNLGDLPWDASTVETTLLGRGMKVFKRMLLPTETVKPGDKTTIGFWVEAPMMAGQHSIYLRSRFNDQPIRGAVANFVVEVPSPNLRGVKMEQSDSFVELATGKTKTITVKFKNTGNSVWKKMGYHAVHLGTSNPTDRSSRLHDDSWLSEFRLAELEEEEVMPGDIGTFKFKINSNIRGKFEEDYQLVMEHYGWIAGSNIRLVANVTTTGSTAKNSTESSKQTEAKSALSASVLDAEPEKEMEQEDVLVEPEEETQVVPEEIEETEKPFRVRISHDASTATLTANTPFVILNGSDQLLFNLSAGKEVSIERKANAFQVKSGTTVKNTSIVRIAPKEDDGVVEILTMERRPTWNEDLNDNRFRGVMEIRLVDNEVAYINELSLEDYLKGLAEVSNDAPYEKQKTIAVLARTYARFYMDEDNRKFPGMPYDGNDDPAIFQRYLGYGVEIRSPNFVGAATETRDQVVTYDGELIKTPYFNQSDGRTRSAEEIWGWTHTPYLKAVDDPWCKGLVLKGHGVGLSGYGATKQAEAGKKFDEIIKYYYTGVAIKKMSF